MDHAFIRFAFVGVVSNALLFMLYLVLTEIGLAPVLSATACYVLGVSVTFLLNRTWSFKYGGASRPALVRYAVAYVVAYVINIVVLVVLVDDAGYPHQWVQGAMILILAVLLFLAQRFWVFPVGARRYEDTV